MSLTNPVLDAAALQSMYQRLGIVTGNAISQKVSDALALSGTDVEALQARMNTIESILDADPNTPEFDVASNIVTQLTTLTQRINDAENPEVIDSLAYKIAELTTQLQALGGVIEAIKTSVGLNADGTIALPSGASDAAGDFAFMYDADGNAVTSLLEAVKLVAKNAKAGIATVEASVADINTALGQVQANVTDLQNRVTNLESGSTDAQARMNTIEAAVDSIDGAFAAADALVAAFCTGVNNGLNGTTDPSCTINGDSGSSDL